MSFRCQKCKEASLGKPVVQTERQAETYTVVVQVGLDELGMPSYGPVTRVGAAIVRELRVCPACAGIASPEPSGKASEAILETSKALENPLGPPMYTKLAAIALENLIARTNHRSQRGKRDVVAGMGLLTAYQQLGGTL